MLTADELARIRDDIGDTQPPTDDDLQTYHDRMHTVPGVALVVLRRRLQTMLATPAQFGVGSAYSQNAAANISALQKRVAELEALHEAELAADGEESTAGVAYLRRDIPCR